MTRSPKVSVVTVNFNMADEIALTLDSVLGQDYANVQAIVIDGGSRDGSREIIQAYEARLGYWVSEPDRNLYDGMNKGVSVASGDWVIFMNSGDRFAAPNVLSRLFSTPYDDVDVLYGHHIRRYPAHNIERTILAEAPEVLAYRMHCSHQSMLMRREILLDHPFVMNLLSADYEAILSAYVSGRRFRGVDCVVAVTTVGGRSDTQRITSLLDRVRLVREHGLMSFKVALHYAALMVRASIAPALKAVLPKAVVSRILRNRSIKGLG